MQLTPEVSEHIAATAHAKCDTCEAIRLIQTEAMREAARLDPNEVSRAKEQDTDAAERSYGH